MSELFWTDERVAQLKQMNSDGLMAREIAEALGTTKNAVVGKCDRDGIKLANRPTRKRKSTSRQAPRDISFRDCQWPIGNHPTDPDFHFCGDEAVFGKPYCKDHCTIAYRGRVSVENGRVNSDAE